MALVLSSANEANVIHLDGLGFTDPATGIIEVLNFDGDGIPDILFGDPDLADLAGQLGQVWFPLAGIDWTTKAAFVRLDGAAGNARFGQATGNLGVGGDPVDAFRSFITPVWVGTEDAPLPAALAALGDLDGDGYEDFAFGRPLGGSEVAGVRNGTVTIVYGAAQALYETSRIEGRPVTDLPADPSLTEDAGPLLGLGLEGLGDINADGFADFALQGLSGTSLIYGTGERLPADISLADLSAAGSTWIASTGTPDGAPIAGGGDLNGDGIADMAFASYSALNADGTEYIDGPGPLVLFGAEGGLGPAFDPRTIDGANGFVLTGLSNGTIRDTAFDIAGDVNGDGIDDLLVGVAGLTGGTYVIFGREDGFSASLDVSELDGTNGFRIAPAAASFNGDRIGHLVRHAGDVNGDGFGDILIGREPSFGPARFSFQIVYGGSEFSEFVTFADVGGFGIADFSFDAGVLVAPLGDYDLDGFDDVLLATGGQGAPDSWILRGAGIESLSAGLPGREGSTLHPATFFVALNAPALSPITVHYETVDGTALAGTDYVATTGSVTFAEGEQVKEVTVELLGDAVPELTETVGLRLFAPEGAGFGRDADGTLRTELIAEAAIEDNDRLPGLYLEPLSAPFSGTPYGDDVVGSELGDLIEGFGGPDRINGSLGDDTILGGDGRDVLQGGPGEDSVSGGLGADDLTGDKGDDTLIGGPGDDYLRGNNGQDRLEGREGHDRLYGGPDGDTLLGGSGDDTLGGNGEDDELAGGAGADILHGGDGHDLLDAGPGDDLLTGGTGNDTLSGGAGQDTANGQQGADLLFLGDGADIADGGPGDDRIEGHGGDDSLVGADGADTLFGGGGADTLDGGHGADRADAGPGADWLLGRTGADTLYGANGADTLEGGPGADLLDGGAQSDSLHGGDGADTLLGSRGDDTLNGGRGADEIEGGKGDDLLTGGYGADRFVFTTDAGDDRITAFQSGVDLLVFEGFGDLSGTQSVEDTGGDTWLISIGAVSITLEMSAFDPETDILFT